MKINTLSHNNAELPKALSTIYSPPTSLYYRGAPPRQDVTLIAVVGSRRPTPYGKAVIHTLINQLQGYPIGIVSGLALGIDALAHKAALTNKLYTLTVLPGGVSTIYPRSHTSLAHHIIEKGGTLVSEHRGEMLPQKHHFLQRNRLIAGLCRATIVIEAAARSGTLSTAQHALNENREVMAVPGNITSPLSQGTNALIKAGAQPVTSGDDIISLLGLAKQKTKDSYTPQNSQEAAILQYIKGGVCYESDIQQASGIDYAQFAQTITQLELLGVIQEVGGGNYIIN